jgi:hypothetical protein
MKPPGEQLSDTIRSGIIATTLGMMGMSAKLLLSDEKVGWGKAIRHTLAAGVTAFFVGQALVNVEISSGMKMALLGISGASATELIDFAIRWVKAKGNSEVAKIKTNGRKKRKS